MGRDVAWVMTLGRDVAWVVTLGRDVSWVVTLGRDDGWCSVRLDADAAPDAGAFRLVDVETVRFDGQIIFDLQLLTTQRLCCCFGVQQRLSQLLHRFACNITSPYLHVSKRTAQRKCNYLP